MSGARGVSSLWRKVGAGACLISLLVLLVNLQITPPIAGGAGDFSVSSPTSPRWGLKAVRAKKAWEVTQGSEEVIVAVIDSGVDSSVSSLGSHMWENDDEIPGDGIDNDGNGYVDDVSGYDFREGRPRGISGGDYHYHGTFVAGLIASSYSEETGAGGVAPRVSIMDLRFLNSRGDFYTSDWGKLVDAIDYAVDNGAKIINLSLYASVTPPPAVREAVERAEDHGVLVVGIAGNNGSEIGYFGCWKEVFVVGSINRNGEVSGFSNFGRQVELVAPGSRVLSWKPGGDLATGSGTSFSAPHVSGSAALIVSRNPEIGLSELKVALRNSARDIGRTGKDEFAGYGVLDVQGALAEI